MSLSTYSDLKTSLGNWLDRDDLSSYVDDFIDLAEQLISYGGEANGVSIEPVRVREMESRETASMDTASRYIALPGGFLEPRRIHYTDSSGYLYGLKYIQPQQMDDYRTLQTGMPTFYTIIGDEMEFERVPNDTYTVELSFYKAPTALSDANTTNTILPAYSGLYLYGSLIAAEPFLQNDERLPMWVTMYQGLVKGANRTSKKGRFPGAQLVMRPDLKPIGSV